MASSPYLANPTAEESHEALVQNSAEWKGPLSLEAYFRREACLANQDLTRDGGLMGWMLAADTPGQGRQQLCACETLRKRALVATPAGGITEVTCYGVASVFCPPPHRGKGYPSAMIKQLGEWADTESGAAFSVLYSDIGKKFYNRLGWRPFESSHVALHPDPQGQIPQGVTLLQGEDLEDLCKRDEQIIRRRLEKLAAHGKNAIAIVPDSKTFRWHQARENFVCNELFAKTPDVHGALVKTPSGSTVWCLWTRWWSTKDTSNPKDNTMHILRLAVDDESYDDTAATPEGASSMAGSDVSKAIASLLQAARVEASKWTLAEVELWNPSSATLAAARQLEPDMQVTHREKGSIASLRWCDSKLSHIADSLVWTCNEKIAWC